MTLESYSNPRSSQYGVVIRTQEDSCRDDARVTTIVEESNAVRHTLPLPFYFCLFFFFFLFPFLSFFFWLLMEVPRVSWHKLTRFLIRVLLACWIRPATPPWWSCSLHMIFPKNLKHRHSSVYCPSSFHTLDSSVHACCASPALVIGSCV